MRVIVPVTIDAAKLTSSSIPEPSAGEVVYDVNGSYVKGLKVVSLTTHLQYTSLQGKSFEGVTFVISSPGLVGWTDHGLVAGDPVSFTTTGALPTGLIASTTYYVLSASTDLFSLAATAGGAALNFTGTQSGTHTGKSRENKGRALPVLPVKENDWWVISGTTNKHKSFDLERSSQAVHTSPMTQTIAPGKRVAAIAVLGMDAETITITGTSASNMAINGGVVYSKTENLRRRRVNDGYEYCFSEFYNQPSFVAFDVPPITDLVLTITLTKVGGTVSCGSIVVGTTVYLGATRYDAESDLYNFSPIERDEDTNEATLTPQRTVPKTTQTCELPKEHASRAYATRDLLNAVPAVWAALDDGADDYFETLLILGIYKRFTINVAYPLQCLLSIEIEEI